MIDKKNLNRVKGILSAYNGAQIPTQNSGKPKFTKMFGGKPVYSNDGQNWYSDEYLMVPDIGASHLMTYADAMEDAKQNAGKSKNEPEWHPPMEIPGDPKITPNTAVQQSARVNKQKQQAVVQKQVEVKAQNTPFKPEPLPDIGSQLNAPSILPKEPQVTPLQASDLNLSAAKEKSAGFTLQKQQEFDKKLKVEQGLTQAAGATTAALSAAGAAVKAKQSATDSDTTKTVDGVYDNVSQGLQKAGGVAGIVGTAMQFAGMAGDIAQELGGGTDQQTKTDKWMDSAFFSWNIGMLNGFAGKNTQKFGVDQDTLAQVGSSYGGTSADIADAAKKADKKYGLFSTKARKKADAAINKARNQQNLMADIADTANDQRLAVESMGEQAGLAYSMMTSGGYDQKFTYAAKHGGMLEWNPVDTLEWEPQVELNWELQTFKEGGNIELVEELEWVPEFKSGNKIRTIEELIEYAKKQNPRFIQRLSEEPRGIKFTDDEGKEAEGSHYLESRGEYVIPRIQEVDGELQFFDPQDALNKAIETGNYLKLDPEEAIIFAEQYKQGWPEFFKKFKEGGSVGNSDVPEIEETTQKNVIPEGALHKNKHHMEHAEGLTKKGIPVIDDDGEQLAEIEHSEIIFTLEVTKKLEEYYKIFYSDDSTNKEKEQAALDAGKLLVYQILENTEDRTGLIESCKKGGTITFKKTTDDLIEEALEWVPTVIVVEEETVEKSPKKPEKLSEKEQMKKVLKEILIELLTD